MDLQHRISAHFEASIQLQRESLSGLASSIALASERMVESLLQGGRIITCGAGSSTALAQHLTVALVNRFERERPGLPALCISSDGLVLTAIATEGGYKEIYARQVKALAQPGDLLLVICADRPPRSVLEAVKASHERDLSVVALISDEGGEISDLLQSADIELRVPAHRPVSVLETQLILINSLCDLIDTQIFGEES